MVYLCFAVGQYFSTLATFSLGGLQFPEFFARLEIDRWFSEYEQGLVENLERCGPKYLENIWRKTITPWVTSTTIRLATAQNCNSTEKGTRGCLTTALLGSGNYFGLSGVISQGLPTCKDFLVSHLTETQILNRLWWMSSDLQIS